MGKNTATNTSKCMRFISATEKKVMVPLIYFQSAKIITQITHFKK